MAEGGKKKPWLLILLIVGLLIAGVVALLASPPYSMAPKVFYAQMDGIDVGMTRDEVDAAIRRFDKKNVDGARTEYRLVPRGGFGARAKNLKNASLSFLSSTPTYVIRVDFDASGHAERVERTSI